MPVVVNRAKLAPKADVTPASAAPGPKTAQQPAGGSWLDSLPVPPAVAIAGAVVVLLLVCLAGYYLLAGGGQADTGAGTPGVAAAGPGGPGGMAVRGRATAGDAETEGASMGGLRRGSAAAGLEGE